jgi:beta-glucanase (GH16 family)
MSFAKRLGATAAVLAVGLVGATIALAWDVDGVSAPRETKSAAHRASRAGPWKLAFADGFRGRRLNTARWGRYSGQPAGDPGGWWDPSHVVVRRGALRLATYRDPRFGNRWVSGGVSSARGLRQKYGKYLVRFRMHAGRGVAGIILLWPVADVWPPEIDFAENGGTTSKRAKMTATLHHGADDHIVQRSVAGDFTRWHTMGVEWTPRRLVYTLDGRAWATVRSRHVPSERMELDIQTQAGTCGDRFAPCPGRSTPRRVDMQVDWVRAYAYRR